VKLIAGDDILADTCMENIVGYSKVNPDAEIVDSCMQYFLREFKLENFGRYRSGNEEFFNTDISSSEQYNLLLRKNYISAPSVYIKKNILIKNNFFDEKYFIEDYPFFLKATKSGEKFYFMPKLSAYYRAHQQSASLNVDNDKLFTDFYKKMLSFDREQRIPYLKWYEILKYYYRYYLKCVINQLNMNKNNLFCRCIFELLYYSPIVHINTLKNKIYNRIQKN
jgi:GT2 family glycosyltransferase